MNKILYVVQALLLLASCTHEVGIGYDSSDTENIQFGVIVRGQPETRAAITTDGADFDRKFKLWAGFENAGLNMDISAVEITAPASGTTTTSLLWNDNNTKQYFYALHPAASAPTMTVASDNSAKFSYTVSSNASAQHDLLVAGYGPIYKKVVSLTFVHALTRVTFEAKIKDFPTGSVVKLTKVEIKEAKNQGNGKFTGTTFAWTGKESSTSDFTMTFPVESPLTLNSTESQKINPTNIANSDGYDNMFLLPHTKTELDAATLVVSFTVNDTPDNRQIALAGLNYETDGWEKGVWVNYQITITFEGIEVNAAVLDWVDEDWSEELD